MNLINKLKAEWSPVVSTITDETTQADKDTLATVLAKLQKHGKVVLGMYGESRGWHCSVKMYIALNGCNFEVKSKGYDAPTPLQAAQECLENMQTAISSIHGQI